MMAFLYVFLGGGVGSMCRFAISKYIPYEGGFPLATLMANILSSVLLGYLFAVSLRDSLSDEYRLLLMTGLCGGFSTFSTFSLENQVLWEQGNYVTLLLYVLLSIILGIVAIVLGMKMA